MRVLHYVARAQAECLLTLAALERSVGRLQEAAEALEEAEAEIKAYPLTDEGLNGLGLSGNQVIRLYRRIG